MQTITMEFGHHRLTLIIDKLTDQGIITQKNGILQIAS